MSSRNEGNQVLKRMGARELTGNEIESVNAGGPGAG